VPDFEARFTLGTTLGVWKDPADGSARPSRIFTPPGVTHKRRIATVGVEVRIVAFVGGVGGPLDASLGGRLFIIGAVEYPGAMPLFSSPAGQSSDQRFTPDVVGHYTLVMRRAGSGGMILHLDAAAVT
jgi:hypothetical protein